MFQNMVLCFSENDTLCLINTCNVISLFYLFFLRDCLLAPVWVSWMVLYSHCFTLQFSRCSEEAPISNRCLFTLNWIFPKAPEAISDLPSARWNAPHSPQFHANDGLFLCSDDGPPCTCPLCASDWSSCVPHSEGLQLSRDLGATYLELPSLNHVFVGRYFGSVVGVVKSNMK